MSPWSMWNVAQRLRRRGRIEGGEREERGPLRAKLRLHLADRPVTLLAEADFGLSPR